MRWRRVALLAVLLAAPSLPPREPARAEPPPGTCTVSATALSFGSYDVFASAPRDATGTVVYRCNQHARDIAITIDSGGAPSFNPRRMLNGTEALSYNLYLDAGHSVIWGDGTAGSRAFIERNPRNNRDIVLPVYGRIPAGQDVSVGTYRNTVTVTIQF